MAIRNITQIDTTTARRKLTPRREPYFNRLGKAKALGFRRTESGGNWIARYSPPGVKGYRFRSLGSEFDLTYEDAIEAAREWFATFEANPDRDAAYTVAAAVDDYVRHLTIERSESAARHTRLRLDNHLIPPLGEVALAKLTTATFLRWRDGMVKVSCDTEAVRRSKDSANRTLAMAKAAFNRAYRLGLVDSDTAWRRVQSFRGVSQSRKLFLTEKQVQALLEVTEGGFHNLVRAAVLTGARYGELIAARVRDLDAVNGVIHLDGKTGARDCYLSDDALAFFKTLARSRFPTAFLLVKDDGEPWGPGDQDNPLQEAVRAAVLPSETVFYSLRHFHISRCLLAHVPIQVIAENCGTSIRMIERHYGKFLATDRRKLLNQVEL